jgi:formate dehydrogenase major subunit
MGVNPYHLPGQQPLADEAARQRFESAWGRPIPAEEGRDPVGIIHGIESGRFQGLLVLGGEATGKIGNAVFEVPIFSVLMDNVVPKEPPYPDVVLPGANFAESEGSYTNCERRIQRLRRALSPPAGKQNWEVIAALSAALGYPMKYRGVSDIQGEITKLVPAFVVGEQWPFLGDGRFNFEDGLARLRLAEAENNETLEALASLS